MSKIQYQSYYKRNINNNINNYKDYNNNNHYNYYYYHNYKKNNYNEERKKINNYNNKLNEVYINENNKYNNQYNDYKEYNQYNEYNEYNNSGYNNNNYIYPPPYKKKKTNNRYNNNLNNNIYENNEEIGKNNITEIKNKKEILKVKINIKDDKYKELIIYKEDNIDDVVNQFCNTNFIDENLIQPLCNKIKRGLGKIDDVTNNIKLSRDSVVLLEKAKKLNQNK